MNVRVQIDHINVSGICYNFKFQITDIILIFSLRVFEKIQIFDAFL